MLNVAGAQHQENRHYSVFQTHPCHAVMTNGMTLLYW